MELRNLLTFIQVAERKSFSKAAEALSYTQSTVSAQIKQLEDELGTKLFDRINHSIKLTESGKNLIEHSHRILNVMEEMKTNVTDADLYSGTVRFAMAPSVCDMMMGETYMAFHKMYPNINVKISAAETFEMLKMLDRNEADIIFAVDRHIYDTQYVIASETKVKMNFVAPKNFPLANRKQIDVTELLRHPFILTEKGLSYRKLFDENFAKQNLEITPVIEMGNTALVVELVELGLGISFLPEYVTRKSFQEGKICYLDVKDFTVDMWRQLLYHKDKWISPAMRKVIDHCTNVSEKM